MVIAPWSSLPRKTLQLCNDRPRLPLTRQHFYRSRQRIVEPQQHFLTIGACEKFLYPPPDPQHRNNRGFLRSSRPPNRNTLRNSGGMLRLARARMPGFSGLWRCCGRRGDRREIPRKGVLKLSRGVPLGR